MNNFPSIMLTSYQTLLAGIKTVLQKDFPGLNFLLKGKKAEIWKFIVEQLTLQKLWLKLA